MAVSVAGEPTVMVVLEIDSTMDVVPGVVVPVPVVPVTVPVPVPNCDVPVLPPPPPQATSINMLSTATSHFRIFIAPLSLDFLSVFRATENLARAVQ